MRRIFVRIVTVVFGLLFLSLGTEGLADQLVWKPINPSFGGNPFNADWLLAQAEAQKEQEEEEAYAYEEEDPLEQFKDDLNRQILNQLASKLISTVFGEQEIEPGHYEIGDYIIDISSSGAGITIEITDIYTGQETSIEIPYY